MVVNIVIPAPIHWVINGPPDVVATAVIHVVINPGPMG